MPLRSVYLVSVHVSIHPDILLQEGGPPSVWGTPDLSAYSVSPPPGAPPCPRCPRLLALGRSCQQGRLLPWLPALPRPLGPSFLRPFPLFGEEHPPGFPRGCTGSGGPWPVPMGLTSARQGGQVQRLARLSHFFPRHGRHIFFWPQNSVPS